MSYKVESKGESKSVSVKWAQVTVRWSEKVKKPWIKTAVITEKSVLMILNFRYTHLWVSSSNVINEVDLFLSAATMEEPKVQRSYRPCGDEHTDYCKNDGQCIVPQDADKPACM